jgi:hypothetical protein
MVRLQQLVHAMNEMACVDYRHSMYVMHGRLGHLMPHARFPSCKAPTHACSNLQLTIFRNYDLACWHANSLRMHEVTLSIPQTNPGDQQLCKW